MWIVDVTEKYKIENIYDKSYFPRKIYYKKDALDLIRSLDRAYGVKATLKKIK